MPDAAPRRIALLRPHPTEPGALLVPLRGSSALAVIDAADAPLVARFTWRLISSRYVGTTARDRAPAPGVRGQQRTVYLARLLVDPPAGMEVDHVDHDPLNNRRSNLRIVTPAQNRHARRKSVRGNSVYIGVSSRAEDRWLAFVDGRYLGTCPTEEEAARLRDAAMVLRNGEGTVTLNFPGEPLVEVPEALRARLSRGKAPSGRVSAHGFHGVHRDAKNGRYWSRWGVAADAVQLGSFDTPEEAARAYDAALCLLGREAVNFPGEPPVALRPEVEARLRRRAAHREANPRRSPLVPRPHPVLPDAAILPVRRGRGGTVDVLIDAADADRVSRWTWRANEADDVVWARIGGKTWLLHRFLLADDLTARAERLDVDHVDGDRLNNRRCNLEIVDRPQHRRRERERGRRTH